MTAWSCRFAVFVARAPLGAFLSSMLRVDLVSWQKSSVRTARKQTMSDEFPTTKTRPWDYHTSGVVFMKFLLESNIWLGWSVSIQSLFETDTNLSYLGPWLGVLSFYSVSIWNKYKSVQSGTFAWDARFLFSFYLKQIQICQICDLGWGCSLFI